jgi:dihydroorotate dehydrogenase
LRNEGVDAIIRRLKDRPQEKNFVVGVSIARTNDEQSASLEEGIQDYCYSFRRLNEENVGDYYTLNISCPNAFGGETFAVPHLLERLLGEVKKIPCSKPVYIKMPINISWDVLNELIALVVKYSFSGVIIGNLQKDYETLEFRDEAPREYRGGLSGKPCFHPSNELIKKARAQYQGLTIVGCGGVLSPVDALYKFEIGSDLIHLITGIIFEGPSLVKKICRAYSDSRPTFEREKKTAPTTLHATIGN